MIKVRWRYLKPNEEKRLYAALDKAPEKKWLKPLITVALHTGLRRSSLCELRWDKVNMSSLKITFNDEKRKNYDIGIPLTNSAYRALEDLRKVQCEAGHVFHDSGRKLLGHKVQMAFKRTLLKAKIENFNFHGLRNTFATKLIQSGVDLYKVLELLGYKDFRKVAARVAGHNPLTRPGF